MKFCFALSFAVSAQAHIVRKDIGAGAGARIDSAERGAHTLAGSGNGHAAAAVGKGRIVPPLEDVEGDKEFYGPPFPADYPHDLKPQASANFKKTKKDGLAYPKLQDHETFHDDFVKDDNSDGGKWSAQMAYDKARTKVSRETQEAKDAEKRVQDAKTDVDAAAKKAAATKRKEEEAEAAATEASEAATEAVEKAAARQKEVGAKAAQSQSSAEERRKEMEKKAEDAKDALEKQKEAYKNCVKELEDARAKVEELEKKRPNFAGQVQSNNITAEESKALEEAKARTAHAEADRRDAVQKLVAARKSKEQAKEQLRHEKEESATAQQQTQKQAQEVKEAEKELSEAKANLRQLRGLDSVPGKDPSPPQQAAAHRAGAPAALALAAVLAASLLG